ncbi:hypothetical protein TVAG_046450 [Trichomonas vaginalis G3]|uniref:Uncharacterized protein n=1 Tax=Trichomonas vaginalis (strain ATCC PRA-98 / G3) TaxID=412133 RepID=A2DML4_TRIV3|nr:maturation of LSU-rRNA [Trichomonas vaginalis G3]EAY18441.1 hypothetical protein TVAG_046450 [Trichomonas vaginalis G3]KAI5530280.1 maturation of LSU-rRNA [Trichomonas vaginalis G3]|eukprot:XP_001579427.1 hypothetical protein [Trichomonas vaginalis G3]
MSQPDFHQLVDQITQQYDQLLKENVELKSELASLKAQLSAQRSETNNTPKRSEKNNTENKYQLTRKSSKPFWQTKLKTTVEWQSLQVDFSDSITAAHVSSDGIYSFGTVDSNIYLYCPDSAIVTATVDGLKGAINSIKSDSTTGIYASCSGDGNIHIWSPKSTSQFFQGFRRQSMGQDVIQCNTILQKHTAPATDITWLGDTGLLVSGSWDKQVCVWDVVHSSCIKSDDLRHQINTLDSYQTYYIAGLQNGEIAYLDKNSQDAEAITFNHGKSIVTRVKFIDDSSFISGGSDSKIKEWDIRQPHQPLVEVDIDQVPTKFDVRGFDVLIPSEVGRMRILDLNSKDITLIEKSPFSYSISEVVYLDDNFFLAASWDGQAATGKIAQ